MRSLLATAALCISATASAASGPYDEAADARAEIAAALSAAKVANGQVLVVFGANWCGDCKVMDMSFKSGKTAALIDKSFKVVKVNVGRFDRNVDVAQGYELPLKRGIPAIAALNPQGTVDYATRAGELADARNMGEEGIYLFFSKLAARPR